MTVVISSAVVLSPDEDTDGNNGYIGYENLVTTANVAADSSDANYPDNNLANPSTHLRWESDSTADQYITVTLTGLRETDYMAIARHNMGTEQITLSVEGYTGLDTGGSPDWGEIIAEFIPADDQPILMRFDSDAYIGVRLKMQLPTGASEPTIGVMYVGTLLVLQRRLYVGHAPLPYQRRTRFLSARSINGQFLGRTILGEQLGTNIELKNLTPTWFRTYLDPCLDAIRTDPFFFAWRPGDYPLEVGYCWLASPSTPVNTLPNGMMAVDIAVEGLLV